MMRRIAKSAAAVLPFAAAALLAGCGGGASAATVGAGAQGAAAPAEGRAPKEQYVVVVDLSASMTQQERDAMRQLLNRVGQRLSFGDRLVVMQAQQNGLKTAVPPIVMDMPAPDEGLEPSEDETMALESTRGSVLQTTRRLFNAAPVNGTDLFAAVHEAAARAQQSGGRHTTIIFLSDMLQCTPELCMEHAPVPPRSWITARRAQGLIPTLGQACVVVIGADPSTARGVRVKQFWKEYFAAAGATLRDDRYVHLVTDPEVLRCR